MQICFVCNEYPPGPHGGIGSATQVLARGLVAAGHHVRVVGVYPSTYPAPDFEEDQGVRIWRFRSSRVRFSWPWSRYRLYHMIATWARRKEIDLVEVPDWEGWAAGWPRLPVPLIVRLNGTIGYFAAELGRCATRRSLFLERASLRRADYWCSVSLYTARRTREIFNLPTGPDAILHNIVESRPDLPRGRRHQDRVVFTGTLTAKKGIASLIRAWPSVVQSCPRAQLHIFGKDGRTVAGQSMRSFLESELNGQVNKSVFFRGHVDRGTLYEELRSARAAVFPSFSETFGIAPLEAMTCGCPTIYSRRGPGPELIDDGRHALLVDPDQPQEIATAIVRLLGDDPLAWRLGNAGQQHVRQCYSLPTLLPKNTAFYRSCIESFHTD